MSGIFFIHAEEKTEDDNIAILLEGPVPYDGIPEGIGDNVVAGYMGRYSYSGNIIDVYYTTEDILIFSDWEIVKMGDFTFYQISAKEIFFKNRDKWSIFILFHESGNLSYKFVSELTKKMLFFAKTEEFFKVSSFPAIININR